ncbi:MAG: hypothetical protein ACE5JM_10640, partial [Armatimonadota bacterium]
DEAVAVAMKVGEREDVLLYSYEEPALLEAAGIAVHARLALARKGADGQWSVSLMDGKRVAAGE